MKKLLSVLCAVISMSSTVGQGANEIGKSAASDPTQFLTGWSQATTGNAKSVAYGNGVYVAAGDKDFFDGTIIYSSTNGTEWARIVAGGNHSLYSICFGQGKFVAAGFGVTGVSENGSNWNFQVQTQSFIKVIDLGLEFASVTADGYVGFSADGMVWKFHPPSEAKLLGPVTERFLESIAYGNGRYVIAGEGGLSVSTNKTDWQEVPFPEHTFFEVAYGKGIFVAAATQGPWSVDVFGTGRTTGANEIWTSTDGVHWEKVFEENGDVIQSVAYGNGTFIAAGAYGHLILSTDGRTWVRQEAQFDTFKLSFVANRFFSASHPFLSASPEVLSLEIAPTTLQIYGPIGKTVKIHTTDTVGADFGLVGEVILTAAPTVIERPSGRFIIGTLE